MFVAFVTVLILLSVPLAGGKLVALAKVRIKGWWLVAGALLVQVAITVIVRVWPHGLLVGLHLGSYALIGVALWQNRRLPGLLIIAARRPAQRTCHRAERRHAAGLRSGARRGRHGDQRRLHQFRCAAPTPILAPLGDIVATPAWLPFRNVISIGDCIALIGVAVLVHAVCDSSACKSAACGRLWLWSKGVRDGPGGRVEERSPGA